MTTKRTTTNIKHTKKTSQNLEQQETYPSKKNTKKTCIET